MGGKWDESNSLEAQGWGESWGGCLGFPGPPGLAEVFSPSIVITLLLPRGAHWCPSAAVPQFPSTAEPCAPFSLKSPQKSLLHPPLCAARGDSNAGAVPSCHRGLVPIVAVGTVALASESTSLPHGAGGW